MIVQLALAAVVALAVALAFRDTGEVTVNETLFVAGGVDATVGACVGCCVGVAVRCAVAVAVGAIVVADGEIGAMVATADVAGAADAPAPEAVGVTRTSCGVVPGLPVTAVTRALEVAVAAASALGDPDSIGAQAPIAANARSPDNTWPSCIRRGLTCRRPL
jgi:hypothetical protein